MPCVLQVKKTCLTWIPFSSLIAPQGLSGLEMFRSCIGKRPPKTMSPATWADCFWSDCACPKAESKARKAKAGSSSSRIFCFFRADEMNLQDELEWFNGGIKLRGFFGTWLFWQLLAETGLSWLDLVSRSSQLSFLGGKRTRTKGKTKDLYNRV